MGLQLVIAKSFARIHRKNLINYGILPVAFADPTVFSQLDTGDVLVLENIHKQLKEGNSLEVLIPKKNFIFTVHHNLTHHMIEVLLSGGLTNWVQSQN